MKESMEGMFLEMLVLHGEGKSPSDAIEDQEVRGQKKLCDSKLLPTKMRCAFGSCNSDPKKVLRSWGVEVGEQVKGDELFVECKLPDGWSIRPTEHAMWSDLVDAKGRKRGAMFYKAAFYDRKAHLDLCKRFNIIGRYDAEDEGGERLRVEDADGTTVFTSELHKFPEEFVDQEVRRGLPQEERQKLWGKVDKIKMKAEKECEKWLKKNWPKWRNERDYWD